MNSLRLMSVFIIPLLIASPTDNFLRAKQPKARGKRPAPAMDRDFYDNGAPDSDKVFLGKNLFFDKILSGNKNISCATCHHALTDTGDGLSLPVGEGGRGLGVTRDTGSDDDAIHERVPRNAPPVFNLGAREFVRMFHDGRVQIDETQPSGFDSPAGDLLPTNLENVLAVQAMFPVTSGTEMAGQAGENEIADAAAAGDLELIWETLAARLRDIPEYVEMFQAAFPDVDSAEDITYTHAANAIAAFEAFAWRFDDSPFDRYLRRESSAMTAAAKRGMRLFYGKARCSSCHSGTFQTDHQFHAIAMPQIGNGKGDNSEGYDDGLEDFGRERVTGDPAERFKFRTPTLRNVALTGPWGHDGAYNTLRAVVEHHLDPVSSLEDYLESIDEDDDNIAPVLPSRDDLDELDFVVMSDLDRVAEIAARNELSRLRRPLTERQIDDLLEFLQSLTDPAALDLRRDVPARVPSELPLAE